MSSDQQVLSYQDEDEVCEQISKPQAVISSPETSGPPAPQGKWSREHHIDLVNVIGEPKAGVTTRSKVKDSEAASAQECLYVNFLSQIEPKKILEALEDEGWVDPVSLV